MIEWTDTFAEQVAAMPDDELLRAYQQTTGEPGHAVGDALLAEIQRRDLAI